MEEKLTFFFFSSPLSLFSNHHFHHSLSIAWGCCGHVFHLDCIQRWLKTRSACPLCNREWDYGKIEKQVSAP